MATSKKSILITGCSTGIGRAAAIMLHERGYQVFATARQADDVEVLSQLGMHALQLDVDDSASIQQTVAKVLSITGGTLDALFNNAGFGQTGALEDMTREAMRQQFETNVFGLLEVTNCVLPAMRKQGHGRIINVSSVLGLVAMPYRGAYNASKFAVEGLTDTLRLELMGSNIQVALIEPGPIETQFRENAIASFDRHLSEKASVHQSTYRKLRERTRKNPHKIPFTLGPEAVVKKLIHAIESPRPKIRYYVTIPTYLLAAAKWILPTWLLDKFLQRQQ